MRKDFMAMLADKDEYDMVICPFCGDWRACEHDRASPTVYNCHTDHWWCHRCLNPFELGIYDVTQRIERISRPCA